MATVSIITLEENMPNVNGKEITRLDTNSFMERHGMVKVTVKVRGFI